MARVTLIELHLDGAQLTANAPFSGEGSAKEVGESIRGQVGTETESTEGRSGSGGLGVLLGLVAIVGLIAVARRYLSGDGTSMPERETEDRLLAD